MALDNSEQLKDDEFFKSSYGLIFFGVPNLGLNPGDLKTITDGQPNQRLIIDLEGRSESEPTQYLDGLRNQFIRCCKKQSPPFEIVSYYERRKTATLKVSLCPSFAIYISSKKNSTHSYLYIGRKWHAFKRRGSLPHGD